MPFEGLQTVTVFGHFDFLDVADTPAAGTVTFTLKLATAFLTDVAGSQIIVPKKIVATLDDNGDFATDVPVTDDPGLSPTGFTWRCQPHILGAKNQQKSFDMEVLSGTPDGRLDLATVVPAVVAPGVVSYVLVQSFDLLAGRVTALEDAAPADGSGLPPGGHAGQTVVKLSDDPGDADWEDPAAVSGAVLITTDQTIDGNKTFLGDVLLPEGDPPTARSAVPRDFLDLAQRTVTTDTAITGADDIVKVNSASAHAVTLPDATTSLTKFFTVKNINTGTVTVGTVSGQTIDGASTYVLAARYASLDVVTDGANWEVL